MLSFITWEHVATGALVAFGLVVVVAVIILYTFERSEKGKK